MKKFVILLFAALPMLAAAQMTAEVKKEAKASKSMKGEWEAISPEEDAIKKYKESYLGKTKEIGGFEIGKPKSSKIDEAYWFYGENELENTPTSYIMRFVCGEGQIKHSSFISNLLTSIP